MTDTLAPSAPQPIPSPATNMKPSVDESARKDFLGLHAFSPVNQNGSFEFDRVVKSGEVLKRTKKTKVWKTIYLVLRPHTLSIYKDRDETKLRHQIILTDLTAVARQRDPKKKAKNVFGLFSPSRNYHLAALSDEDAQDWVENIRREARIDEEEEEMILASPHGGRNMTFRGFERHRLRGLDKQVRAEILSSDTSDGEAVARPLSSVRSEGLHSARRPSHTLAYSGNEQGSFSDFSDNPAANSFRDSTLSFSQPNEGTVPNDSYFPRPSLGRNASQISNIGGNLGNSPYPGKPKDEERVVCQGWLYILKSKGGVRQWKKLWAVLRPKSLGLYKNEEEYSATLIIPFPTILNAVDIDPISKSKRYCIQVIAEDRNYRLCAPDEEQLTKWLGALKSLLAKRKEAEVQHRAAVEKAERERAAAGLATIAGAGASAGAGPVQSGRPEAASSTSGGSGSGASAGASVSGRATLPVR